MTTYGPCLATEIRSSPCVLSRGLLALGPLLAALAGAGLGTLVGTLVGAGIADGQAALYETGLRSGSLLVTAHTPAELTAEAVHIFSANGAHDVYTRYDPATLAR